MLKIHFFNYSITKSVSILFVEIIYLNLIAPNELVFIKMKYTTEVIIELPRNEVIKKLDNIENIKHWQRGLIGVEHISGTPGEFGAKMNLKFKFGRREMTLEETITKRNFPDEFHATYNTKGMHNIQQNYFTETPEGFTKWKSESEFLPTNFMMRVMTFLMPSAFKKQSLKYLTDFKNFAEKGTSVANNTNNS